MKDRFKEHVSLFAVHYHATLFDNFNLLREWATSLLNRTLVFNVFMWCSFGSSFLFLHFLFCWQLTCNLFVHFVCTIVFLKGGGGAVHPWFLWEHNFKIWVGHDGQGMYQQSEGSFESIGTTLPMWCLGANMWPKYQNLKQGDKA